MKSPVLMQPWLQEFAVSTKHAWQNLSLLFLLLLICSTGGLSQDFEVYVGDAQGFSNPPWKILKFDENGQNSEVFINTNLGWPQDILFLEDQGIVLISNLNTGLINRHDAETGTYIDAFASGIGGPTRMKIGPDNTLYVLQWTGNGRVRRYELDGTYLGEFTSVGVSQSIGLDWDTDDNLYVSSYNGRNVRKYDATGSDLGLFINTNLSGPTNIWFDDNGDLLVTDYNGTAVKRFNSNGVYQGDFIGGLNNAEGVAYLPNGNILIGDGGTSSVKMFAPDGTYISDFISSGAGGLQTPNAIVVRDLTTVNTNEPTVGNQFKIYPTVGTKFYLEAEENLSVAEIAIYDSSGKQLLLKRETMTNGLVWQASQYPNGIYLLELKFVDGTHSTTQLIVER